MCFNLSDFMVNLIKLIIICDSVILMISNNTQQAPLIQGPSLLLPSHTNADTSYMPSKYSKAFNNYSRNQLKSILPFIASISRTCPSSSLYPICKLLKAISKIFLLNQIQVIFLAYLIRQTGWDIRDKTIFHNAENVQDIIYYSIDNLDYKRIILYLMITAFTVKFYLNDNTNDILEESNKRCPNFKQIFQTWNKKHSPIITKINPRTLNIVYKRLFSSTKQEQLDYNMMVDSIIQISPAYNPERQKQNTDNKKKAQDKKQEVVIKKEQNIFKNDKSGLIMPTSLFSSSALFNLASIHHQNVVQNNNGHLSGFNPFGLAKSDRLRQDYLGILGSSVVGGIHGQNYDMNQDVQCGELVVGLHDGQSQENIMIQDKQQNNSVGLFLCHQNSINHGLNNSEETPYYTSVINLTRRSSVVNLGTSQVILQSNNNNNHENTQRSGRIQASIISLEAASKGLQKKK